MRTRKLTLIAGTVAISAALGVLPASATIPANICPYPPNDPTLSLNTEFAVVRRSSPTNNHTFSVGGNLTRNRCALPGGLVGLFYRERPGRFFWLAQGQTNTNGGWGVRIGRVRSVDLLAIFSGEGQYGRAVSRIVHVTVVP